MKIELPPKLIPVFSAKNKRYRGAYGGRGSAKTQAFAKMCAIRGYILANAGRSGIIVCGREFMNSIADSSFSEVKWAIESEPMLSEFYEVGRNYIRSNCGKIQFKFVGLRHNLSSVKGKAEILLCWIDEAEDVSENAWVELIPTVRAEGSEIWLTWNPRSVESSTHKRFRMADLGDRGAFTELNYQDNPWFPEVLEEERKADLRCRPDMYEHIWNGAFYEITDAQVFKNKFEVRDFSADLLGHPIYGMDFGFAQDPTTAVELYTKGQTLYVARECGKVGLELDDTALFVKNAMPEIPNYSIIADSARPETISYLKRTGLPRIKGAKKGKGSIEHGIEFIKSFERVVIHPSCTGTAREFRLYSYRVDKRTQEIVPEIVDDWNHYIDAIRYALEPLSSKKGGAFFL